MPGTMSDIAARMEQRKQRHQEEQQRFERKQNPDAFSEPSELDTSREAPKPKQRHRRSSNKSPFDDDSSLQFGYHEKRSTSTTTTSSNTPRQPNKFLKKPSHIPVTTEKISVTRSPRDVSSPRSSSKQNVNKKPNPPHSTGLLSQSALLARAVHRQELFAKGVELEPGAFDNENNEDESSSDATTTGGTSNLFGSKRKTFLKSKPINDQTKNPVPDLQHLDSVSISDERERKKKTKHKKEKQPVSVLDTEDDSLEFIGDGSLSEGHKTPTSVRIKSILKSPKDSMPKEIEYSVQFSENLYTVQTDDGRIPTPTKPGRITTPRRVQIANKPTINNDDMVPSENESISTVIDTAIDDDEDAVSNESIVENIFANLVINDQPVVTPNFKTKSPRRTPPAVTVKKSSSTNKFHQTNRTVSDISDDDNIKIEEIPEEISTANYSEDFSSVPTETPTPRSPTPPRAPIPTSQKIVPKEKQTQIPRKITTDDREVQVDLTSAPFQSSLNQVHSIYLINQNDLNETRPSSVIRSVVDSNVLQSLLTTNPVLLAVDDLIREQSSLLRTFVQLQRTYYESTIRNIRPEHVYVTKNNTLRLISDQQQSRMQFQSNDESTIAN